MDSSIKQELIDEINQLAIKSEPFVEVEGGCSTSNRFASYDCSVVAQHVTFSVHLAQLDIDYNVQVSVTPAGIRVGNHAFTHFYYHGLCPRIYSSAPGNHCVIVVIHNVVSQEIGMVGQLIDPSIYNLRLTFKNSGQWEDFVFELRHHHYHRVN